MNEKREKVSAKSPNSFLKRPFWNTGSTTFYYWARVTDCVCWLKKIIKITLFLKLLQDVSHGHNHQFCSFIIWVWCTTARSYPLVLNGLMRNKMFKTIFDPKKLQRILPNLAWIHKRKCKYFRGMLQKWRKNEKDALDILQFQNTVILMWINALKLNIMEMLHLNLRTI